MERWNIEPERVDEAVDRVLHRLGSAPAPAGMEARLAQALRARSAAHAAPRMRRLRWVLPSAAVALCLLAAGLIHYAPRLRPAQSAVLRRPQARPPQTIEFRSVPSQTVERDEAQLAPAARPAAALRVHRSHHETNSVPAYEAASFPAPPEPLTHEERLLLAVAKQHDPGNAAFLNPRVQAKEMAWNRAAFAAYFYQPTEEEREKHAQQSE